MSKKHFVQIAKTVKYNLDVAGDNPDAAQAVKDVAAGLANVCASFNPSFDRAQFLAACGVEAR